MTTVNLVKGHRYEAALGLSVIERSGGSGPVAAAFTAAGFSNVKAKVGHTPPSGLSEEIATTPHANGWVQGTYQGPEKANVDPHAINPRILAAVDLDAKGADHTDDGDDGDDGDDPPPNPAPHPRSWIPTTLTQHEALELKASDGLEQGVNRFSTGAVWSWSERGEPKTAADKAFEKQFKVIQRSKAEDLDKDGSAWGACNEYVTTDGDDTVFVIARYTGPIIERVTPSSWRRALWVDENEPVWTTHTHPQAMADADQETYCKYAPGPEPEDDDDDHKPPPGRPPGPVKTDGGDHDDDYPREWSPELKAAAVVGGVGLALVILGVAYDAYERSQASG